MKIEVLVSTLNKDPKNLIDLMNIQTDAIIICQCNKFGYEEIYREDSLIRIFYFNERGIGLSRNNALMRARGDILLFADDDEILENNYESIIVSEFINQKADMLVFNINSNSEDRKIYNIKSNRKIHIFNCLRYGAVRMAIKKEVLLKNNVHFSLLYGGGAKYGSGEDSIFIYECVKKRIKIYSSPKIIATVDFGNSSWFNGYNEKYFFDKGSLMYSLHKNFAILFIQLFLIRHRYMFQNIGLKKAYKNMILGYLDIKKK